MTKEYKMKRTLLLYSLFIFIITALLYYQGCSELHDNPVHAPEISGHGDGWIDTNSANFHGKYIFDNKLWNLTSCQTCHGVDYAGGSTGSSCITCHTSQGGPQNCRLCHGNPSHSYPPKALNGETSSSFMSIGSHDIHLSADSNLRFSARVQCSECHLPLNGFSDPNHIGPNPDGIAEINFGILSKTVLPGDTSSPNPTWERNTGTCANTYCHGNFRRGNRSASPIFNQPNTVTCGSCHGDPITGNPNPGAPNNFVTPHFSFWTVTECYFCHNQVMNPQGFIYNKSKHVNGEVNLNQ